MFLRKMGGEGVSIRDGIQFGIIFWEVLSVHFFRKLGSRWVKTSNSVWSSQKT